MSLLQRCQQSNSSSIQARHLFPGSCATERWESLRSTADVLLCLYLLAQRAVILELDHMTWLRRSPQSVGEGFAPLDNHHPHHLTVSTTSDALSSRLSLNIHSSHCNDAFLGSSLLEVQEVEGRQEEERLMPNMRPIQARSFQEQGDR